MYMTERDTLLLVDPTQTVESYMAYLTDKTSLISNPGIRPDVRDDVLKIAQITATWKNMSFDR